MESIFNIFSSENVWVLIPLGGIVLGGVLAVMSLRHKHSERMAMIKRGMHPDSPERPGEE